MKGEDSACGHCDGSCFGGHCLFDVADDVGSPVGLAPGPLNGIQQPGSVRPVSEIQQLAVSPAHVPSAPQDSTAEFFPAPNLWRPSKGEQQALQGDVAFLSTEASSLRAQLRSDEQQLQSLRSEKFQLKQQLRTWGTVLANMTAREARMAELVGFARNDPPDSELERWQGYGSTFGSWIANLPGELKDTVGVVQGALFMLMLTVALVLMYKFRARIFFLLFETEEVKLSWQDVVWSCLSCCHVCWPLEPVGRALGLTYQTVEISEIQLGHLLVGGDVFVSIDIGTNPLINTRTINQSDGVFIRFKEAFKVNVRKTDKPCMFKVIDQDVLMSDQIAQLEINAWEFVKLALQGSADASSGYYRFDLQHRQRRMKKDTKGPGGLRPYIAMRLREVTNDKYQGVSGEFLAKRSQKEFLQTLSAQPGETHFSLDPNTNELKLP